MNFIDHIRIEARSGKGGKGSAHLRREKFMPKGGPDGGDGGRGGNVILRGNSQLWTLLHLRYTKHVIAEDGAMGTSNQSSGLSGKDVVIEVPLGTVAKDDETGEALFDITEHGQEVVLLKGGRGGLGNQHFHSSTFQTPRFAQPGEPGQQKWFKLELKVLADVGLVGFPNAGKSTLLSVITAAKPKIADYAFTTLTPNLGMVPYRDHQSFVMADIPGIIEGAHEGKGLGLRFLRHIERNSVLLFMVPADSNDIAHDYRVLVNELKEYSPELLDKERLLAVTKCDMLDAEMMEQLRKELPKDVDSVLISSVARIGLDELKDKLWRLLHRPVEQRSEFPEWSA
ncbi:MAG: GTPase ObgE [Flavobacteriales bacterium]|jgi:GTP-binding protein|nr:GTPase ObgE [Flavobacteriales bacterium]